MNGKRNGNRQSTSVFAHIECLIFGQDFENQNSLLPRRKKVKENISLVSILIDPATYLLLSTEFSSSLMGNPRNPPGVQVVSLKVISCPPIHQGVCRQVVG